MQLHQHQRHAQSAPPPLIAMDLEELIELTEQMADILDEESEYLQTMQIKNMSPLHEEKLRLTLLLEAYERALQANPTLFQNADPMLKRRFKALSEEFRGIVKENFRLSAVARTVNQRVVQAIADSVFENQRPSTYNRQGTASMTGDLTLSLNLNQRA